MRILPLLTLILFTFSGILGCGSSGTTAGNSSGVLNVDGTRQVPANGSGSISIDYMSSTGQQSGTTATVSVSSQTISFDKTSIILDNSGKATFTFIAANIQDDAVVYVSVRAGSNNVIWAITIKGTGIASGTWTGSYVSSLFGANTATVSLVQNSTAITGSYFNSLGSTGSISGVVNGNIATFTINITTPGCSGSFAGTGTFNNAVTPATMAYTYNGATNLACGGSENGTGTLTK